MDGWKGVEKGGGYVEGSGCGWNGVTEGVVGR